MKRPGARVRAIAARLCRAETMARLVDPTLADLQAEYGNAMSRNRKWESRRILAQGYLALVQVMAVHGCVRVMAILGPSMDLHIKKVWVPGAASCLLFFGFHWVLIWLPFDKTRFQFLAIPYLVLPFGGALAAYGSRRMKGSVLERIVSALFPVFAFVALFAVRIGYGLFFEGTPYTLPHFLGGLSVTLVFIVVGGLLLVLGAWPFCRPHLRERLS